MRIEAAGYRPATSRAFKNDEGAVRCDFALTKGKVLSVAVRLPDGQPAANAEACLCPVTPGKFYHMATFVQNGQFAYREMYDPTKAYLKTGSDGQLAIPPQDSQFLLIVLHDRGFAKTTSEELAAKPEIKLTAWARLEGSVRRGTKPLANAKLDVSACGPYEAKWGFLNFREDARTSAKGEFVLPRMKPGRWLVRLLTGDRGDPRLSEDREPAGRSDGSRHTWRGGAARRRPTAVAGGQAARGELVVGQHLHTAEDAGARIAAQERPRPWAGRRPRLDENVAAIGGGTSVAEEDAAAIGLSPACNDYRRRHDAD